MDDLAYPQQILDFSDQILYLGDKLGGLWDNPCPHLGTHPCSCMKKKKRQKKKKNYSV